MTVRRSATKVAWSTYWQTAFGTALLKTDLTKFLRLADPLLIDESAEHWTDRGMIGGGHDWETQRGKNRQFVRIEIPVQPMPIDFAGYLLALFFAGNTAVDNTGYYEHTTKFIDLNSKASANVFSLAILEDGNDRLVQDLAVQSLTIKGEGSNRMEMGASLVGSKIATNLSTYTWPTAADLRYVYNHSGLFTVDAPDKKSQVRSFELTLDRGISLDLAWVKVALEADRIYPSLWPFTPDRSMSLKVSLLAETGNLATFRAAQQAGTEDAIVLSCVGIAIDETGFDGLQITVPKGVYTDCKDSYQNGLQQIDLTVEGHYDSTPGGPLSILTTNAIADYLVKP